ncbi:hypothetical protein Drorol1_Dr00003928 [Drosera rotundifolia]
MAAAGASKLEEMSHPAMDQLQGLDYCIDSNPSWVTCNHHHQEDKAKVVQTMLFVQGINTLLQTLFGTRLPAAIGGSYAYMVPIVSIINDPSLLLCQFNEEIMMNLQRFRNTMKAVQGSMIVASSIQVILGYSQLWAICSRFFSPQAMAPVIALAGFGLFDRVMASLDFGALQVGAPPDVAVRLAATRQEFESRQRSGFSARDTSKDLELDQFMV